MRRFLGLAIAAAMTTMSVACGPSGLERLTEARQIAADILVQFTKAADASNRAVMADSDEASIAYAREAEQARASVARRADALRPVLDRLGYSDEARALDAFIARFRDYETLDRQILGLAVENTNLKAQRLSFGPAQREADAWSDTLRHVVQPAGPESWRVRALVDEGILAVREIQVLQAPHIAEADDTAMSTIEARMSALEKLARGTVATLTPLIRAGARVHLAAAAAALDRFMALHAQIVVLSRRNTNVRSLALTLNEKGRLTGACEESARQLREALDARTSGTR